MTFKLFCQKKSHITRLVLFIEEKFNQKKYLKQMDLPKIFYVAYYQFKVFYFYEAVLNFQGLYVKFFH